MGIKELDDGLWHIYYFESPGVENRTPKPYLSQYDSQIHAIRHFKLLKHSNKMSLYVEIVNPKKLDPITEIQPIA